MPLTAIASILHRITGVVLAIGTLALVYWLIAAAMGEESFNTAETIFGSWIGRLALFGWTLAFFFHLANGIRHMFWDAGLGFDLPTTYRNSLIVFIGAVVLTLAAWVLGYMARGAF